MQLQEGEFQLISVMQQCPSASLLCITPLAHREVEGGLLGSLASPEELPCPPTERGKAGGRWLLVVLPALGGWRSLQATSGCSDTARPSSGVPENQAPWSYTSMHESKLRPWLLSFIVLHFGDTV